MRKMAFWLLTGFLVLSLSGPSLAATTQVDALIKKLVEKGILDKKEAIELKGEIAADEKLLREEGLKMGLPEWVQKMKLKGDFRLRYQYERKTNDTDARSRGRVRYRLGVETDVVKNVKVGAGISSGADDPRSTNQSFTDTFERPDVRLDLAYAEWKALVQDNNNLSVIAGIHPRPDYLWVTTDMQWDSDINPQGGAIHYDHKFSDQLSSYINGGVWIIDENSAVDRPDPYMHFVQSGLKWKQGKLSTNVAGIFYWFNSLKETCPDWSSATNSGITTSASGACSSGNLRYDYDSLGASAEVALAKPLGMLGLEQQVEEVAIFGDFISNVESWKEIEKNRDLDDGTGWAIGARIGDKKVNGQKQWQLKYMLVDLQKDAWPDFMPDSDRYAGKTGVRGHEVILEIGLVKNVILAFDWYLTKLKRGTENPEQIIQADLNFKF